MKKTTSNCRRSSNVPDNTAHSSKKKSSTKKTSRPDGKTNLVEQDCFSQEITYFAAAPVTIRDTHNDGNEQLLCTFVRFLDNKDDPPRTSIVPKMNRVSARSLLPANELQRHAHPVRRRAIPPLKQYHLHLVHANVETYHLREGADHVPSIWNRFRVYAT